MTTRPKMNEVAPDGFATVLALDRHVRSQIDHDLLELVKLRASMINGCAFCIDMHGTVATEAGEDGRRLLALAAWEDSPFFTKSERAALALTDAVTNLHGGVSNSVWDNTVEVFGAATAAELVLAIATINVWNRIALSTHLEPPALATN